MGMASFEKPHHDRMLLVLPLLKLSVFFRNCIKGHLLFAHFGELFDSFLLFIAKVILILLLIK